MFRVFKKLLSCLFFSSQKNNLKETEHSFSPMIVGIGTDIVDMRRIQSMWDRKGDAFFLKILTPYEQAYCLSKNASRIRPTDDTTLAGNSFAKIFAAKEATLKAIGQTEGIEWHHMEIQHEDTGRPYMLLHEKAYENVLACVRERLGKREENRYITIKVHVSLSDDIPYAVSYVLIEANVKGS